MPDSSRKYTRATLEQMICDGYNESGCVLPSQPPLTIEEVRNPESTWSSLSGDSLTPMDVLMRIEKQIGIPLQASRNAPGEYDKCCEMDCRISEVVDYLAGELEKQNRFITSDSRSPENFKRPRPDRIITS